MISVVIPAYNAEQFLAECLDSLLAQTFGDWEAVVVDDGSIDSTLSIARSYSARDPRIHTFSKPNEGISKARNFGVSHSAGSHITFLDSDDCLYPDALMIFHRESSRADIISAGISRRYSTTPSAANYRRRLTTSSEALEGGLYQTSFVMSACGKLFSRSSLILTPFNPGRYEDLDFMYRILCSVSTVLTIGTPLYFYRTNPASFINTFTPSRLHVLRVTAGIEASVAATRPQLLPAARDRRLSANFNMFSLLSVHRADPAIAASCWALIRAYRRESLINPKVRPKNKLGILLSFLGSRTFALISRLIAR